MEVRLTRSAELDLLDGYDFYESQHRGLGIYFLDSLYADLDSLVVYAGVHVKANGRFHRALAKRFPFAVYYELTDQVATIVAILDCRQNPQSIKQRLN